MKKLIVVACLALASFTTFAQQKIGYISSEELITSMPEAIKADKEIGDYAKTFQDQLTTMQKELETKYKAYEAGVKSMTEAMKDVKEKELQDLQNRIMSTQQSAEEKIAAKKQEMLRPITEKADKAIQTVAKEKGYSFIFDTSSGGIVYATEADNIIAAVKAKLGIKDTPAPAPKTQAGGR